MCEEAEGEGSKVPLDLELCFPEGTSNFCSLSTVKGKFGKRGWRRGKGRPKATQVLVVGSLELVVTSSAQGPVQQAE